TLALTVTLGIALAAFTAALATFTTLATASTAAVAVTAPIAAAFALLLGRLGLDRRGRSRGGFGAAEELLDPAEEAAASRSRGCDRSCSHGRRGLGRRFGLGHGDRGRLLGQDALDDRFLLVLLLAGVAAGDAHFFLRLFDHR